jgi:hypothetical protein
MGKAGYAAVLDIWKANEITFSSGKARAEYVEWALSGLRYVFKDPDASNVSPSVPRDCQPAGAGSALY